MSWLRTLLAASAWILVALAQPPLPEEPPEEDETLVQREYSFNPLQAEKEIRVGNYYFKKGKFRAAAMRYEEATKWDATNPEAFRRLGEACEKKDDPKAAVVAYEKFLEIAADAREAREIRKRVSKLKKR